MYRGSPIGWVFLPLPDAVTVGSVERLLGCCFSVLVGLATTALMPVRAVRRARDLILTGSIPLVLGVYLGRDMESGTSGGIYGFRLETGGHRDAAVAIKVSK